MSIYKFNSVFHQVDISLLRHFFAVATFGGFSKAAKATGVSQPALSLGLQKLERSLGTTLIDRSNRPFHLTPQGLTLLTFCQRFQGSFESVIESLGTTSISVQKRYRVGTALSVGVGPLDRLCAALESQKEVFELELITQNTYQLLNDVYEGKLDGALVPNDVYDSRLKFSPLIQDQICFVVGENLRGTLSKENWKKAAANIPLITFPRDTPMRTLTDKICVTERLEFKAIYVVNSIEALKTLATNNRGGAFVVRTLIEPELRSKSLFEEKIPIRLQKSGISFVMRPDESDSANSRLILDILKRGR